MVLQDINSGTADSNPGTLTPLGTNVYFSANDGISGRELWKSDGTSAGTEMVFDIHPGGFGSDISGLVAVGNSLVFSADDGATGDELWKSKRDFGRPGDPDVCAPGQLG